MAEEAIGRKTARCKCWEMRIRLCNCGFVGPVARVSLSKCLPTPRKSKWGLMVLWSNSSSEPHEATVLKLCFRVSFLAFGLRSAGAGRFEGQLQICSRALAGDKYLFAMPSVPRTGHAGSNHVA